MKYKPTSTGESTAPFKSFCQLDSLKASANAEAEKVSDIHHQCLTIVSQLRDKTFTWEEIALWFSDRGVTLSAKRWKILYNNSHWNTSKKKPNPKP